MRFSLHWNTVGILGIGAMSAFLFSAGVAVGRVHLDRPTKAVLFLCGLAAALIVNAGLWAAFFLAATRRPCVTRSGASGRHKRVTKFSQWETEAARRDAADPLARFRDRFYVSPNRVYMDGNSLGLLSRDAEQSVLSVLAEWKHKAVEGWTEAEPAWFGWAERLGAQVAPLVGAEVDSVVVTGSTTGNLHQLLATLFAPTDERNKIVADALNFPSDIFALESHLRLRGLDPKTHLVKVPSRDGRTLDEADIIAALLRPDVQMAVLPSVVYTSGQLLDMEAITRAACDNGVLIGWDCSHSIGAVKHELDTWGADFAFWCHYKYLNAGPGAVGGLYVNRRHFGRAPGLAGWWGSNKQAQFDMTHEFAPANHAGALQIGTPPILALAPLAGTLAIHAEAGMENLRNKSLALTDFLREMCEAILFPYGFSIATPKEAHRRGGHIALVHSNASALCRALRQNGVVPDFRPPDIIRLAPIPLYNTFGDCVETIQRLAEIVAHGDLPTGSHNDRELVP